jgi:WXG100 family type VII secretion target
MSVNSGDIFVNYGQVQNVEDILAACDNAVGTILQEIETAVQPMIASWLGSSVDAYGQIQAKWNADTSDMQNILSQYGPTLAEMKDNYANTDNGLALEWAAIH